MQAEAQRTSQFHATALRRFCCHQVSPSQNMACAGVSLRSMEPHLLAFLPPLIHPEYGVWGSEWKRVELFLGTATRHHLIQCHGDLEGTETEASRLSCVRIDPRRGLRSSASEAWRQEGQCL